MESEKRMSAITKFGDEWNYFCSRINFGKSPFDARAICFMNEIDNYLKAIAEEAAKKQAGD